MLYTPQLVLQLSVLTVCACLERKNLTVEERVAGLAKMDSGKTKQTKIT